jgi:hypothetical protein
LKGNAFQGQLAVRKGATCFFFPFPSAIYFTLMLEAARSSKMLVSCHTTWCHHPATPHPEAKWFFFTNNESTNLPGMKLTHGCDYQI